MKVGNADKVVAGKPAEGGRFKQLLEGAERSAEAARPRANPTARTPKPGKPSLTAALPRVPAAGAKGAMAGRAIPRVPAAIGGSALAAPAEKLSAARQGMHAEAARLGTVRAEAHASHAERLDARLIDLICRELCIEFAAEGKGPGIGGGANTDTPRSSQATALPATNAVPPPLPGASSPTRPPVAPEDASVRAAAAVELIEKLEVFVRSQRPALAMTLAGGFGARVEIERLGPREVAVRVQGKRGPPTPEELTRIREEIRAKGLKLSSLSVA